MAYIGRSTDGFGVRERFVYVVSGGATSVSGVDANGAVLKFSDGKYVDVYLNGVLLKPTTDYNTNTANTISGISSMAASDEVTVIVYDIFAVADTVSATQGGTFSGNVELASTDAGATADPTLTLYRNSASPADADDLGSIEFKGRNDNSEDVVYSQILSRINDASDGTEDGQTFLKVMSNGTLANRIQIAGNSKTIFSGKDVSLNQVDLVFEGSTADANETTLTVVDPSQDNTITLPDATGTVVVGLTTLDTIGGIASKVQIEGTDYASGSLSVWRNANDDAGAYLLLGKSRGTSVGSDTIVQDNDDCGIINFVGADGGDRAHPIASIRAAVDGTPGSNDMPGRLEFWTTADGGTTMSERVRIHNNGQLQVISQNMKVGNNASSDALIYFDANASDWTMGIDQSDSGYLKFSNSTALGTTDRLTFAGGGQIIHNAGMAGAMKAMYNAHASSPYGIVMIFNGCAPNNTDNYFFAAEDTSTNRIKLYSSGTVKNSTGTYTSFSDERLKTNIVDAKSQWEDIKALNFKNFIKFDNPDFKQLGLIAQDVEKTSPNLVFDSPPDKGEIKHSSVFGTLYKDGDELPEGKKIGDVKEVKSQVKNVKDSILYMKAVKALQEAMTRIETLEAKVKTLEEA